MALALARDEAAAPFADVEILFDIEAVRPILAALGAHAQRLSDAGLSRRLGAGVWRTDGVRRGARRRR